MEQAVFSKIRDTAFTGTVVVVITCGAFFFILWKRDAYHTTREIGHTVETIILPPTPELVQHFAPQIPGIVIPPQPNSSPMHFDSIISTTIEYCTPRSFNFIASEVSKGLVVFMKEFTLESKVSGYRYVQTTQYEDDMANIVQLSPGASPGAFPSTFVLFLIVIGRVGVTYYVYVHRRQFGPIINKLINKLINLINKLQSTN